MMCEPDTAQFPCWELCLFCSQQAHVYKRSSHTCKRGWALPIFLLLSARDVCMYQTLSTTGMTYWGEADTKGQYSHLGLNPLPTRDPLVLWQLRFTWLTISSCHLPWKVTCKVSIQLLLSLQSFTLDYSLKSDPIVLGFPARNLLSDSSYHRLVAGRLSKINIPTFFTTS